MYTLYLTNGTYISNLTRINDTTFEVPVDPLIYWQLTDFNLMLAMLCDEDEMPVAIYQDYTQQNYVVDGDKIRFKIFSLEEQRQQQERQAAREKGKAKYEKRARRGKK